MSKIIYYLICEILWKLFFSNFNFYTAWIHVTILNITTRFSVWDLGFQFHIKPWEQQSRHFADIFKYILNKKFGVLIEISLNYVPKVQLTTGHWVR